METPETLSTNPRSLTSLTRQAYDDHLIERYNQYTFFPTTAQKKNREFAQWVEAVEQTTRERLQRYGVEGIPENVERAIAKLHEAEIEFMRRIVRARELAPGAYIVGPSNYLKRARPDKAHKCIGIGVELLDEAKARLDRAIRRHSPRRGISSDDPEAIEKLYDKIEKAECEQRLMVNANKIVKDKKIDHDEKILRLALLGISEQAANRLFEPDFAQRIGFPDYRLTNNGANIRQMKKRAESLQVRRSQPDREAKFDGGVVRDDVAANRVQIFFDEKPSVEIREALKQQAFKWALSQGAWQRMRGGYAASDAGRVLGVALPWIALDPGSGDTPEAEDSTEDGVIVFPASPSEDS